MRNRRPFSSQRVLRRWAPAGRHLNYLERVPVEESRWRGECFVFDSRVAVDHSLNRGSYDQCYACRHPITETEKASKHYRKGVRAPTVTSICRPIGRHASLSVKQVDLASARGQQHIGAPPPARQASADSLQSADPLVEKPSGIKQAD